MTQERRKDEQPRPQLEKDWDDTETLAGQEWKAPASPSQAVPSELAKRLRNQAAMPFGPEGFALLTEAADELDRLAAPVAADTEQATALRKALEEILTAEGDEQEYEAMIKARALLDGAHLATPADAGAGAKPGPLNTLLQIAQFMDDNCHQQQTGVDTWDFASEFDYNLGHAASTIRSIVAELQEPVGQSPAPVTAEPAQSIGLPVDLIHDFRDAIAVALDRAEQTGYTARKQRWLDVRKKLELAVAHPAPADRDAIRAEALEEVMSEILRLINDAETDPSREAPILLDFVRAKLKSMERAADAKGDQQ